MSCEVESTDLTRSENFNCTASGYALQCISEVILRDLDHSSFLIEFIGDHEKSLNAFIGDIDILAFYMGISRARRGRVEGVAVGTRSHRIVRV